MLETAKYLPQQSPQPQGAVAAVVVVCWVPADISRSCIGENLEFKGKNIVNSAGSAEQALAS